MTNVEQFINNLKDFGHSFSDLGLSKGATIEQIDRIEKTIKRQLPESFKTFLQHIDGQSNDNFYFLPDQALLLSCEEIIDEYEGQSEFFEENIDFYNDCQCENKIRCPVWSESKVPIAGRDGYYLFIDFDPAPNGTYGQIIFLVNECDSVVLSPNFSDFIDNYNYLIIEKVLKVKHFDNEYGKFYRLTTDSDFLDGIDFAKLFGQK